MILRKEDLSGGQDSLALRKQGSSSKKDSAKAGTARSDFAQESEDRDGSPKGKIPAEARSTRTA
jgi:hypothetical protein